MQAKALYDESQSGDNRDVSSPSGKILKGLISEAPFKYNISSIPSKYQNTIIHSNSKPAFGDSNKRFFNLSINHATPTPGPGRYNLNDTFTKIQSKKGSGFFASETKLDKLEKSRSHGPGPGAYKFAEIKSKSLKKLKFSNFKLNKSQLNSSKSTALISSQIQNSRSIFKNQIQNSINKPSVGAYQLNPQKIDKQKSSYSTFKSKIGRFITRQQETPPIGIYQYQKPKFIKSEVNFTRKMQSKKPAEFSHQKNIQKAFRNLQKQQQKQRVGPGTYNFSLNATARTFKMKDNMYDRFGQLKPIYSISKKIPTKDNEPELPRYEQPHLSKFQMAKTCNSIFKSTTKRWDFKLKNQMDPGTYNPAKSPPKKSHLINFMQKWV